MEIKPILENRITEIWQEFSDLEMCRIPPLSVDKIDETGLVFIGINSSIL